MSGKAGRNTGLWRVIRWALALLLAAAAAWLSIRQVQWATLEAVLARVRVPLLALALSTVLVTTAAKAVRWQVLLRPCEPQASGGRILRVLLIGQMVNTFLSRLGDVTRAAMLGPQAVGGFPAVLGTLIVEKALDGAMGLLVLVGLALGTPLPASLRGPVLASAALTGVLLALLALAASRQAWAVQLYHWLAARLPDPIRTQLANLLADFGRGLALFSRRNDTLLALAWSLAVWGLAALTNVVLLAALDIDAPGWTTWLVLVTGYIATFLPTVPAQIGVFEYASVLALTAAGVGPEEALVFALLLHLLVYGPPAILGPLSMAFEGLNWTRLKEAQSQPLEREHAQP